MPAFAVSPSARAAGQISDPVDPASFLTWAKRNDVVLPPELEAQVTARGHHAADWKTLYEELKAKFNTSAEAARNDTAARSATIEELEKGPASLAKERDDLARHVAELEAALADTTAQPAPLHPKERDSLLKLVIGMAVKGYGYNPAAARSGVPNEIAGDLDELEIPLDSDTVRKWLRTAAEEFLPKERPENRDRSPKSSSAKPKSS